MASVDPISSRCVPGYLHSAVNMGASRIPVEMRSRIVNMWKSGKRASAIVKSLRDTDGEKIVKSTVLRLIKRYQQFGDCKDPPRKSATVKVTQEVVKIIVQQMRAKVDITSPRLQELIEKKTGLVISQSTVCRICKHSSKMYVTLPVIYLSI